MCFFVLEYSFLAQVKADSLDEKEVIVGDARVYY